MCGIIVATRSSSSSFRNLIESLIIANNRRGPDYQAQSSTDKLDFHGSVLSLRGKLTPQPLNTNGNLLAFNGEIYSGIEINDELFENDTAKLATILSYLKTEDQIMQCMSQLKGEWAFAYYHVKIIYIYGRH